MQCGKHGDKLLFIIINSEFFFPGHRYTTADGLLSLNAFDLSLRSQTFHWRSSMYTRLEKYYWNVRRMILLILCIVKMTKHLCWEALNRVRLSANYYTLSVYNCTYVEGGGEKGRKHGLMNTCTYYYTKRGGDYD